MSERTEELEGQLSEAASLATTWKNFMEHPGWKLYEKMLVEQASLRQTTVCLTPVNSEYTPYTQEFYKGEASGFIKALDIPQTQFEEADMKRKSISQQLEAVDETEASTDVPSRIGGDPFGGHE